MTMTETMSEDEIDDLCVKQALECGLSTKPANRAECEAAIKAAYEAEGLRYPAERIFWEASPEAGARRAAILCLEAKGIHGVEPTRAQMADTLANACWGQHDAGWLYMYKAVAMRGIEGTEPLAHLQRQADNGGWFFAYADDADGPGAVVFTDRPAELHFDSQGRLHHTTGLSVQYRDLWGDYCVHGISVPRRFVERDFTHADIASERNVELRRVMVDLYGMGRYLRDAGAKILHEDVDMGGQQRRLLRLDSAGDEPYVVVQVVNSTPEPAETTVPREAAVPGRAQPAVYKTYFLRVHPELRPMLDDGGFGEPQLMTCQNAVASTAGLTGEEYRKLLKET